MRVMMALLLAILPGKLAFGASFEGLGDLAGGAYSSRADDLSDDGSTVVGASDSSAGLQAFRWQAGSIVGLGDLSGGPFASEAHGVSADGSVVVGDSFTGEAEIHAFRWQGSLVDIGADPIASAVDASADGNVAVGVRGVGPVSSVEFEAARWVGSSLSGLGDLPGGGNSSAATAVSADGAIVVGESDAGGARGSEGFRWENGTLTSLLSIAPGFATLAARGISADGLVIVGDDDPATGMRAFRLEGSTVTLLPDMRSALDTSADGSIVVGWTGAAANADAVIWDATNGTRRVVDVLLDVYHVRVPAGWKLQRAVSISADGSVIAGNGTNPVGDPEAWRVELSPSCGDGLDNDGDGLIDLADPGCDDAADLTESSPALPCDDFLDNDGDGLADLADPGCSGVTDPDETAAGVICDDGLDNDGDGGIDLAGDPGCDDLADPSERSPTLICDDGLDNDTDGASDFPADDGCASSVDPSEQRIAGELSAFAKVGEGQAGFVGPLASDDAFASALAVLGDLDADGDGDAAAGAPGDPASDTGRAFVLRLDAAGAVQAEVALGPASGGFGGTLAVGDLFGSALAGLGDLGGDGTTELAIGAPGADDGGNSRGALWIVSLDATGQAVAWQRIDAGTGGFGGVLDDLDLFGSAVAALGDLDGDSVTDLLVGAPGDRDGGLFAVGAVWVVFLNADGTVKGQQKISATQGGFGGALDNFDSFGAAVAAPGDLDGDGVLDALVGAPRDGDGGNARGALWVLFLNANGTVKSSVKISELAGGLSGGLADSGLFGAALGVAGDLDLDGDVEVVVGNPDDGAGRLWVLSLGAAGTVVGDFSIADGAGFPPGQLGAGGRFGAALATRAPHAAWNLLVGAPGDDGGDGAFWRLSLDAAVCGNGTQDFAEICDDGNAAPGDGCSATCQLQDQQALFGSAAGGSVSLEIAGQVIAVPTSPGEAASAVLAALALEIANDATLAAAGVSAQAAGPTLIVTGALIDATTIADAGLSGVPQVAIGAGARLGIALALAALAGSLATRPRA